MNLRRPPFLPARPVQALLLCACFLPFLCGCGQKPAPSARAASPASAAPAAPPPFHLVEVSAERGVAFQHSYGSRSPITIVEAMGSGCAFLDFDNDGWQDIFLVNAGDDFQKPRQTPGSKLFRNKGDGSFEDATARSGIVIDGYAMGCCIGDYDNDGQTDLFVSGYGKNWLFRNKGGGSFEDVTAKAGIPPRPGAWGMGSAFVDVDRDGRLDLYVANYVRYDPKIALCRTGDTLHGCTPNQYRTQRNELYMNRGGGKFTEEAVARGADDPTGAGLGVVVSDFDADGWPDIFVANDGTPNALLHNRKGKFKNVAQEAGVAFGEDGVMRAGMGTDSGDADGDGRFDIVITNFQHEPNSLYRNEGGMQFADDSFRSGLGTPALSRLKFGVTFADFDRDGKPDLYVGNGHVYDNVAEFDDTATFEQPDQIFRNTGAGQFAEVLPETGAFPGKPSVTRAVAAGDFNNDGAPDLLINSLGRPARLLENRPAQPAHWLGVKLEGAQSNRSAIGARLTLQTPEGVQAREVRSGSSYLAQPDLRALFGLGSQSDPRALKLTIHWPSGKTQTLAPEALDRYLTIREPQ